jgi:hypothetical protein
VGGGTEQKCRSGRKAQTIAHCGMTAAGCGSTAIGGGTGKSVNVDKQTNESCFPLISSTSEILKIVEDLPTKNPDRWARYTGEGIIIENLLKLPGLSRDIIVRIMLAEDLLGFGIPVDMLEKWRQGSISAEQSGNVKQAWIAFANNVKRFYEQAGVKWTKCRPNRLREIDNKLADLKKQSSGKIITGQELLEQQTDMSRVGTLGNTLSTFKIRTPEGECTAKDFMTLKESDDMERYGVCKPEILTKEVVEKFLNYFFTVLLEEVTDLDLRWRILCRFALHVALCTAKDAALPVCDAYTLPMRVAHCVGHCERCGVAGVQCVMPGVCVLRFRPAFSSAKSFCRFTKRVAGRCFRIQLSAFSAVRDCGCWAFSAALACALSACAEWAVRLSFFRPARQTVLHLPVSCRFSRRISAVSVA